MDFDFTFWLMIIGWIFVILWIPFVIASNRKTHPRALFVLFFAEMWERFSYYGMRALLTLYMTKVLFEQLGTAAAEKEALGIYGGYTAMVYLFPVVGGLIADRIFGFRKAIIWGGALMALGHFTLALEGMLFEGSKILFFASLGLIIVGNGYFKPNISSFLGEFYEKNDPRKDGAFTIFYMGVNIGAFLSTLTCGYVGEKISWHYGFGLAGIGMVIGLLVFWIAAKRFGEKGLPPAPAEGKPSGIGRDLPIYLGSIVAVPIVAFFLDINTVLSYILGAAGVAMILYFVFYGLRSENKAEGQRLWVVAVLFVFHALFWALFEQAGGSLTLFTEKNVDRVILGSEIPSSVFQSLNAFFIIILAPVFSFIWIRLNKANREPSTPMKFVLGLAQLGLGYGIIVLGASVFSEMGTVPVIFLVLMYLFHTTGELSLSPVGLSMITKLSPVKIVGFVMGAWFLSISLANNMAGLIGQLTTGESHGSAQTAEKEEAEEEKVPTYQELLAAIPERIQAQIPIIRNSSSAINEGLGKFEEGKAPEGLLAKAEEGLSKLEAACGKLDQIQSLTLQTNNLLQTKLDTSSTFMKNYIKNLEKGTIALEKSADGFSQGLDGLLSAADEWRKSLESISSAAKSLDSLPTANDSVLMLVKTSSGTVLKESADLGEYPMIEALETAGKIYSMNKYNKVYITWGIYVVLGAALILLVLVPTLRKWMHGIH
ncbi:MAG: peptide MFS transporter [Bacteroidia bacterium]|nr:peptide MFS transporter [Bacteroidia bacterium]